MCTSVLFSTFPAVEPSVSNVRVSSPHTPCPVAVTPHSLSGPLGATRGLLPVAVGLSVGASHRRGSAHWSSRVGFFSAHVWRVSVRQSLWLSHTPSFCVPPPSLRRTSLDEPCFPQPQRHSQSLEQSSDMAQVLAWSVFSGRPPVSDHTVLSVQWYISDPSLDREHSCPSLSLMTLTFG